MCYQGRFRESVFTSDKRPAFPCGFYGKCQIILHSSQRPPGRPRASREIWGSLCKFLFSNFLNKMKPIRNYSKSKKKKGKSNPCNRPVYFVTERFSCVTGGNDGVSHSKHPSPKAQPPSSQNLLRKKEKEEQRRRREQMRVHLYLRRLKE